MKMKKQIVTIIYSLITIIIGLLFSTTYDSFSFLVFIPIATMFTSYVVCYDKDRINWRDIAYYITSLVIAFLILFNVKSNGSYISEFRIGCMNALAVMFSILGSLAGGIFRYKVETGKWFKKGDKMEDEGNGEKETEYDRQLIFNRRTVRGN